MNAVCSVDTSTDCASISSIIIIVEVLNFVLPVRDQIKFMNNYTFLGPGNIKLAISSIMILTKSHPYPPPNFTKTF